MPWFTRRNVWMLFALMVVLPIGCGKPPMVPVSGTVKFNGKPLKGCKVALSPIVDDFNPNKHGYGFGVTDASGAFVVQHPGGEKGIFPGKYKVTFVTWVNSKGEPIPFDAKPSEVPGGVKNLLPSKYESLADSPEQITVTSAGLQHNFELSN